MSNYSGKYDVYDWFYMSKSPTDDYISKSEFYIWRGNKKHRLDIQTAKDLIPYYPFIIAMGNYQKDGFSIVHLSSESFVDKEEEEIIESMLHRIKKYYKKSCRKNIPFTLEDVLSYEGKHYTDVITELYKRVCEYKNKADIKGLHLPMHEYYRQELYNKMLQAGYNKEEAFLWCFNELYKEGTKRLETVF